MTWFYLKDLCELNTCEEQTGGTRFLISPVLVQRSRDFLPSLPPAAGFHPGELSLSGTSPASSVTKRQGAFLLALICNSRPSLTSSLWYSALPSLLPSTLVLSSLCPHSAVSSVGSPPIFHLCLSLPRPLTQISSPSLFHMSALHLPLYHRRGQISALLPAAASELCVRCWDPAMRVGSGTHDDDDE